jgi:hypothetical protein
MIAVLAAVIKDFNAGDTQPKPDRRSRMGPLLVRNVERRCVNAFIQVPAVVVPVNCISVVFQASQVVEQSESL